MNFEMPSPGAENPEENKIEQGENPELKEQVEALNENAETVGEQLENVDASKLTPEGLKKVGENIERVLGAVYMLAGAAAVTEVWMAIDDISHQMHSMEKVIATVVAATGMVIAVKGFDKLLNGSKKFWAELSPEQKTEISS